MAVVGALALLAGCADAPPAKVAQTAGRHVSPPAVPAPQLPDDSFDRTRAAAALGAARDAERDGQTADARSKALEAIAAWPGDPAAWQELAALCQAASDKTCQNRAEFFRAKVEFANALPIRAAVLGFQTIAEEPQGGRPDPVKTEAARRLWAFYNVQDTRKDQRDAPQEPSFAEEYPYGSMLIAGGVIAGVLTGAKTLANK
ncbi:hypothetical protein [Telmatospirillum sp.]|uniref:hypothetical protein n=1 Tax=Telmatospirillum sp. TaxID=2079197 RepID=UPI0028449BF9|nr:hypothetical protein [Telmatospirillum sp.]MDR3440715.1 hypothetical protein [Telmatospirillum sp.]